KIVNTGERLNSVVFFEKRGPGVDHSHVLSSWKNATRPEAHLLRHGCDTASLPEFLGDDTFDRIAVVVANRWTIARQQSDRLPLFVFRETEWKGLTRSRNELVAVSLV